MSKLNRNSEIGCEPARRGAFKWIADKLSVAISRIYFPGSAAYWDRRYGLQGSSGRGSYGSEARFKADFINDLIKNQSIRTVIDFGSGDGAQLTLLCIPQYLGFDVSDRAVRKCRERFSTDATKQFLPVSEYVGQTGEVAMSLDVVYHLVEDEVFEAYMNRLFHSAERFVVIYSTDFHGEWPAVSSHVRHREVNRFCTERYRTFFREEKMEAEFGEPPDVRRFMVFRRK